MTPDTTDNLPSLAPAEESALERYYQKKPWYRKISQRLGLQTKLIVTFILLIVLAIGSFLMLSLQDYQDRMIGSLTGEAQQISLALSTLHKESVSERRTGELIAIANELVRSSYNIVEVTYFDEAGTPLASRTRKSVPVTAGIDTRNAQELGQAVRGKAGAGEECVSVLSPVYSPTGGRIIGYVRVGISLDLYHQQVVSSARAAAKVGIALVLISVPVAWLLVRRIFLPIRLLVNATKRIAAGEMETRVETGRPDVIGDLARAFNEMTRTVKQQQGALQHVNRQLGDANRDLETKVEQRTLQFETANKRLTSEIAEKEDFLRAVSHDLNAPLRNISGMVTMLLMKKKSQLDEDTLHRLDRIKKNVEIETDLINELLELSRIKTRRQAMENVDLEAMVWDLRGMFENDLKTRGIDLVVDSALPQIHGERARLRQIFQNLIDNAIKYMGDGPIKQIHVGARIRLSEAEFYVRDTGLGIDAEDVGKVFFVFRRGKNTGAQNVSGKGVGLASVKSIVETYSGKIWVESKVGEGSTFRFTINGQYVPAVGGGRPIKDETAQAA
jgi:signal transduction histidine kinase